MHHNFLHYYLFILYACIIQNALIINFILCSLHVIVFYLSFDLKYYIYYVIGKLTLNSSPEAPVILSARASGRPIASSHCSLYPPKHGENLEVPYHSTYKKYQTMKSPQKYKRL